MKNRGQLKILFRGFIFLLCTIHSLKAETSNVDKKEFQAISKEKVNETLELISAAIRANYEKIRTWQAEIDAHTEMAYYGESKIESALGGIVKYKEAIPQKVLKRSNRKIIFALDTQTENLYQRAIRQGPIRYYDANDNNEIAEVAGPFDQSYIVTPTYYIDCIDNKKKGDLITGYRAIKGKVRHQRETIMKKGIFDPRHMIYMATPVWEYLDTWRRKLQENNGDWRIGPYSGIFEEGYDVNYIVYHLLLPAKVSEEEYIFLNLFFSEKAGWNMVKLETMLKDMKVIGRMNAEYQEIDGIYLPKRITGYNFNEDLSLARVEDYRFNKQLLNKDIEKDTFTIKKFDMKNGDEFIDEIENKKYRYQDANLVPISEPNK